MRKSYIINKSDKAQFINDINKAMTKCKTFYNVSEKQINDKQLKITIG